MTKTVVGLFDDLPDAQAVVQDLRDCGVAPDAVSVVARTVYSGTDAELRDLLVTAGAAPRTAQVYVAEVARGGTLVIVHADPAAVPTVVEIMHRHHLVDITRRRTRASTATAVPATSAPRRARPPRRTSPPPTGETHSRASVYPATGETHSRASVYPATTDTHDELAVPVVEEELRIGTRQVDTGGVRVATHVEEIPVEEQVLVRTEQVRVERRAVDRVVGQADLPALHDGAIEVHTTMEDVVVEKQARIVEEVVIHKEVEAHTETITDTVRRTAVEVEELPSAHHGDGA